MKYSEKNKPLVCMQTNNMCYKNTKEMNILGVLIHSTGANNTALKRYVQPIDASNNKEHADNTYTNAKLIEVIGKNSYNNDWNHTDREAGLNCWIGKLADGSVATVQTMPWNYRPWGCGSGSKGSCNNGWIQFEICEDALTDKTYFEAIYKEACEITAYLCKKFNLDPKGTVTVNNVKVPVILCHKDSNTLGMGSNHGDVLHWFPKHGKDMDDFRNDVANLLKPAETKPATTKSKFKVGDAVQVKEGAKWDSGSTISSWVFKTKMYVREIKNNNKIVISTQTSGAVTGTIAEENLLPYGTTVTATKPTTTTKPATSTASKPTGKFAVGDAVKVLADATWHNGKTISSWVFKTKMYVREVQSNGNIVISTGKTGAVTGTIASKYLTAYVDTTAKPTFTPYIVQVTASKLNVRAGAGTSYKVNGVIKAGEKYTIIEEKNGWGKLKSGVGWISLNYAKKV